jgi:hypothetical protein
MQAKKGCLRYNIEHDRLYQTQESQQSMPHSLNVASMDCVQAAPWRFYIR